MKAYMNIDGKGRFSNYWGDKVKKTIKRKFKKSARQMNKKITE